MKKLLVVLVYPIAFTFANIAYSVTAEVGMKVSSSSGIPGFVTSNHSNLTDLRILERKTNEKHRNQWDSALKKGLQYHSGYKSNTKSKKDKRWLKYFAFDYTFDVSDKKSFQMIKTMSFDADKSKSLFLLGINKTTGTQNVFKINSMNFSNCKLSINAYYATRYSLSNPSLVKDSKKSAKQLKKLIPLINRKGKTARKQNFQYTRLLNESCFISPIGKKYIFF